MYCSPEDWDVYDLTVCKDSLQGKPSAKRSDSVGHFGIQYMCIIYSNSLTVVWKNPSEPNRTVN